MNMIRSFLHEESGVTAIEYGLIAALIVIGLAVVLSPIGANLVTKFGAVETDLQ